MQMQSDQPETTDHILIVGRHTLQRLAKGEAVTITQGDCRVTLIHSSDYPHNLFEKWVPANVE